MSTSMGGPALLWVALLLFSPDGMPAAAWKSMVSLNPPWNRIFRGENVTLTCNGNNSLDVNSTKWTHNNTVLAVTTPSLDIVNATFQDSGEYRCQRSNNLIPSQPVYLEVFSDWLLLQSSSEVVLEGESFLIRCHGWKDRNVFKVIYYKNGQALKYWYENHNLSITNATLNDSGNYYCTGKIWQMNYTSESLKITIRKDSSTSHQSSYYRQQLLIPVLVVILFAVDTGLFISTQQQFTFLLKIRTTRKGNKSMDPQPKPTPPKK
ncbi:LOW QUALITY PROTEIN: high affinity immunoglobulin epsilon receptor subunit alpha [Myotis lucifugus]|uniref:LOW QUALITY PROTEIN: high affinity immunoglobulin epsilon receptor subunit alpha n=1 Tax=Myotis lucifugus TaxID=59463 RepID=UPI0006D741F4|nr:LOW QUALITY PROTEIN: high affinity immunoglobulin epsilon receptor subunit alpha [Myotis lucifugus]